ncbi:MAG: hypothetical protein FJ253_08305 [Phycisphaerae bacterium]|nr:hypothetical protein [Phycisphaerae bacterium]
MREPFASSAEHRDVMVICPTRYEASAIRRAARLRRSLVLVSGPGGDAVRRAVVSVRDRVDRVILAGLAGGLDPAVTPGSAYAVSRASSIDGRRFDASWIVRDLPNARLVTAPAVVSTAIEKSALSQRSGASMVDLEGYHFADQASAERLRWCIVRGISDGHDQELPPGIDKLVSPRGRTRCVRAILWTMMHKKHLEEMSAIVGQSMAALQLVGGAVRRSLDDSTGGRR